MEKNSNRILAAKDDHAHSTNNYIFLSLYIPHMILILFLYDTLDYQLTNTICSFKI